MTYKNITVPDSGSPITIENNELNVPNNPIITYIEGDGIGIDISPVMLDVVNTAVKKAYGGEREIHWMEIYAGEKANAVYGENAWLPDETLDMIDEYLIAIKGPLTTPVGGGIRSINVALRQKLDLYVCLRPVRYFNNVPSPVKNPELIDMVIFRENTEDIYTGIEFSAGSENLTKLLDFFNSNHTGGPFAKIERLSDHISSARDVGMTPANVLRTLFWFKHHAVLPSACAKPCIISTYSSK